jgi:hypothetical protein
MRYLASAIAVVLAVAAPCAAEVVESIATLTPTTLDFTIQVTLLDPMFGNPYTVSDTTTSGLTGVQSVRLDCGFDSSSHAVTSVNSIVFLLSYGDKINFTDDATLNLPFVTDGGTPFASMSFAMADLGGSLSTGLQEPWRNPPRVPDPMPVTNGTFPLDRDSDPPADEGNGDMIFFLNAGTVAINGNYAGSAIVAQWWFNPDDPSGNGSEAWNDGNDMPGNGTVSVSLSSVASGVATYDVDVSVPILSDITIPNPGLPGPDPVGHAFLVTTMEFSGQFTREVPILGDANGDRTVNDEDASILGANWMQSGTGIGWAQGDFNGDGAVNDKDAAIMAAHFGETAPGSSVPEPSTAVLLLGLALAGLAAWRRR